MPTPITYFDPRPPRGLLLPRTRSTMDGGLRYPEDVPDGVRRCELLEAELRPCGEIAILLGDGEARWERSGVSGVLEGEDGSLALVLDGDEILLFRPRDRERVSALFLKLASRQY
ncbi:MAG TPA: hypothetical protein VNN09_03960 [Candidatus Competibacteraceae bacterium]|nr:hypothetical protein [Candidatus Competibacteraceae bacterium]